MFHHLTRAAALVLIVWAHGYLPAHAQALTRSQFVARALPSHPALALAQARQTATQAGSSDAGRWMNPMLVLEMAPMSIGSEVGYMARIRQPITYGPSARAGRRTTPLAGTAGQAQSFADRLTLELALNRLWFDAIRALSAETLARDHATLLQKLTRSLSGALATGRARPESVYMAQSQQMQAERTWQEARSERDVLQAQLALAMDMPSSAVLQLADADPTEPTLHFRTLEELEDAVLRQAPSLQAMRAQLALARERRAMSAYPAVPPVSVMAGYDSMQPMSDHRLQVGLEIELPVANAERRTEAAMASADLAMLEAELRGEELTMRTEATRMWNEFHTSIATLRVLRTQQAPLAERRLQSMSTMVASGDIDFVMLVPALRESLEWQLEIADQLAMARTIACTIEALTPASTQE